MMMIIKQNLLAALCAVLFVCSGFLTGAAYADTVTMEISWNLSVEEQAEMTFFRVVDKNNQVVADNVPADARSVQFQSDGELGSWRVFCVLDYEGRELVSDSSASAVWAPEPPVDPVVPSPVVYNITGTITATVVE